MLSGNVKNLESIDSYHNRVASKIYLCPIHYENKIWLWVRTLTRIKALRLSSQEFFPKNEKHFKLLIKYVIDVSYGNDSDIWNVHTQKRSIKCVQDIDGQLYYPYRKSI